MTLITYLFGKLKTAKDVLGETPNKYRLRRPFNRRYGNWSKTLLKSEGQHLYNFH